MEGKTMTTSKTMFIGALIVTVCVMPLFAQDIFEATRKGDLNAVKNLLKENKDLLESLDQNGKTPLHIACYSAQVDVVKYLIEQGANINASTYAKLSPLHWAVHSYSDPVTKKETIEFLLSKSPELANLQNDKGITPLMWAANDLEETIQLLIDHGADVNARDFNGYSALHSWTRWWPEDKSEFLIQQGADVNTRDANGRTPLHIAAIAGRENRARLFLKYGGDINVKDNLGYTPLDLAIKFNHKTLVDFFKKENALAGNLSGSMQFNSYLTSHFNEKEALIWYLDDNSWAIKTSHYLLIFDFNNWGIIPENQSIYNGRVNPVELGNLSESKILVFKSYEGKLDPKIIELKKEREDVIIISGSEIPEISDTKILTPHSKMSLSGLGVNVTKANAGELGFIINVDGLTIYYAGIHGLWNNDYRESFFSEINYVKSNTEWIDFAFFPITNTRALYDFPAEGMITVADELNIKTLFPMGGSGTAKFYYKKVADLAEQKRFETRVVCAENRGDRYFYRNGKIQN